MGESADACRRHAVRELVSKPAGERVWELLVDRAAAWQVDGRGAAMSVIGPGEITLHGRSLSYVQAGSGPVLLLIHGVAGTVENWRAVIGPLSRHYTVVAADLPGTGDRPRERGIIRSVRWPPGCAICRSRSGTSG